MPHVPVVDLQNLLWLLPLLYVKAPRTWVPGEMVTSNMMNTIRDLFIEVESGTADMKKTTLVGHTTAELPPLVSTAGKAALAYDKEKNAFVASMNGSAFGAAFPIAGGLHTLQGSTPATPSAVAAICFALPATAPHPSLWVVIASYPADAVNYGAYGFIIVGTNGTVRSSFNNGPNGALSLSGLNVQFTQTSGTTISVDWAALRIE